MSDMSWVQRGSCAQTGPDDVIWFPEGQGNTLTRITRRVCETCPVRQRCLESAIEMNEWGTWAGTTRAERHRLRVNAQRAATRQSRAA